jgi:hypothetical protein
MAMKRQQLPSPSLLLLPTPPSLLSLPPSSRTQPLPPPPPLQFHLLPF